MTTTFPSESKLVYQRLELVTEREKTFDHEVDLIDLLRDTGMHVAPQEQFWVVAYGAWLKVAAVFEVNRGNYQKVTLHMPSLLAGVLLSGNERFALAHNHPSGLLEASESDVKVSKAVMEAANACGLYFEDHYILTADDYYSFRRAGILKPAASGYDEPVAATKRR